MTKTQAEQLYMLTASPLWTTYLDMRWEELGLLHEQLEWEEVNVKKIQGQIVQIKRDITLRNRVEEFLDNNKK